MRFRAIAATFRKELLETIRDRRTIVAIVVVPIVVYPLLFIVLDQLQRSEIRRQEALRPSIAVWGDVPEEAVAKLQRDLRAIVVETRSDLPSDAEARARSLIQSETIQFAVSSPPGTEERLREGDRASIEIHFNDSKPLSVTSADRATDSLEELSLQLLAARVRDQGLSEGFAQPVEAKRVDVATARERSSSFAARLIPYFLLLMVTLGAMYPAIDVTAGEKERGTMQTLLTAPIRPIEIVTGKYLAVVAVAMVSALLNLVALSFALGRTTTEGGVSFSLAPGQWLTILGLLLPTAFLISALLLAITVFARSFREGQNYVTPVFVSTILGGFFGFGTIKLSPALALVPFVNISIATRDLLSGDQPGVPLFLVFLASAVHAGIAIIFASRVFESEQVLLGGEKPWRDLFGKRLASSVPSGRNAVLFGLVLLVAFYYGSLYAGDRLEFVPSILVTQGLLIVPTLLWLLLGRYRPRETLFGRFPPPQSWIGIILVAGGAWSVGVVVNLIQARVFPGAGPSLEKLTELFRSEITALPAPVAILVIAVLPAVAEEICFRGLILSGLRSTGTASTAVIGSAVLFGIFHLSAYRIVPAAVLGVVLGLSVLATRSLLPGIVIHAANNSVGVMLLRSPDVGSTLAQPWLVTGALIATLVGLALIGGARLRSDGPRRLGDSPKHDRRETKAEAPAGVEKAD